MTVVVPASEKTKHLTAIANQITTLAAEPTSGSRGAQSAALLLQRQREFVIALVEHGAILGGAAAILSTIAYTKSGPATAILAQITALQAQITANTTTNPVLATRQGVTLEQLQRQAVIELLNAGSMSAATVLSTFNYTGAQ